MKLKGNDDNEKLRSVDGYENHMGTMAKGDEEFKRVRN